MRRLIALLFAAVPMLMVAGAVYIVGFTPDVVTPVVEYQHTHNFAVVLLLLALPTLILVGGLIATEDR